jgi:mono/diheme cytochrome c family protein
MRSFLLCCLILAPLAVGAQAPAGSRGELLYSTHCIECHTVQMHWRALRLARDWDTLKAQVRRWQAVARLNWTEEDVDAVARHLNDTIYQFPRSQALLGPVPLRKP